MSHPARVGWIEITVTSLSAMRYTVPPRTGWVIRTYALRKVPDVKLPDAVSGFIILTSAGREPRFLLFCEYRYPVGHYVLSIPSGLIDERDRQDASPILSAMRRELAEETGINNKNAVKKLQTNIKTRSKLTAFLISFISHYWRKVNHKTASARSRAGSGARLSTRGCRRR